MSHHPEALERWYQVLEKDPGHVEALANTGGTLALLGRSADAVGPVTEAFRRDPAQTEAGVHLALARLHLGDAAAARQAAGRERLKSEWVAADQRPVCCEGTGRPVSHRVPRGISGLSHNMLLPSGAGTSSSPAGEGE